MESACEMRCKPQGALERVALMVASSAVSTMETSAMPLSFSTWSAVKEPEKPCGKVSKIRQLRGMCLKAYLEVRVVVGAGD